MMTGFLKMKQETFNLDFLVDEIKFSVSFYTLRIPES